MVDSVYFLILAFLFTPFARSRALYSSTLSFGTLIVAFFGVPLKAFAPTESAVSFFVLIVIDFRALQPLKASLPIVVTEDPIVTFSSFLQLLNALFPMVLTFFPMETVVRFGMLLKAEDLISVTLYVLLPFFTVEGIVTLLAFLSAGPVTIAVLSEN